jgi:hypothetical protein
VIPTSELRGLIPRAGEIAVGLSHAEFNWHPAPGAWSVAECLAHLNTVDELYSSNISDAIASAGSARITGTGPFKMGRLEAWFVRFLEPPYQVRFKAPKTFQPGPEHSAGHLLETWRHNHVRLLDLASDAEGLHLTKVRVVSPATRLFTLSLLGAFHVIAAHDRRHLWQAARVRAMLPKISAAGI